LQVTTKGRYGVNAMVELALCYGQGPVSLREIAERQCIPENYLEQLMNHLRKAELVTSIRGSQGGYVLSRPPSEMSVGEVLYVLEGDMSPVKCITDEDEGCGNNGGCPGRILWEKIYERIKTLIDAMTLEEICLEYRERTTKE